MISTLVTDDSEKAILVSIKELEQVTYIQYLIIFQGGVTQDGIALNSVLAFLNLGSKVNVIHLIFVKKLSLLI